MNAESRTTQANLPCRARAARGGLLFALAWSVAWSAAAHMHIQIGYGVQGWELDAYDFDTGAIPADQIVFPVAWQARRAIPADPRFTAFLGESGDSVWVLPEVEAEGVS